MPTGRVIIWREGERSHLHFGYIRDNALGEKSPREENVYFDEGDIDCNRAEIERNALVSFEYSAATPAPGRNPRGYHVRPMEERTKVGTVAAIKPHESGFYGFINADGEGPDLYFNDRALVRDATPTVGMRVRFVVADAANSRPRALRVEVIKG